MAWTKWVFGGLGWAMGGPVGGIIGFAMGAALDSSSGKKTTQLAATQPGDFAASLLVLCAAVMKSDNKILRSELDFVKRFFVSQFGEQKASELILVLRDIIKQDIPVQDVSMQIKMHLDEPSRLQLLHLLFGIANADGEVHPAEVEIIGNIAHWMGISSRDFDSIKGMFVKNTTSIYKVLEVDPSATNDEVKKAYRSMAAKHHPDKVHHLGPDYQKAAQEKIQAINAAYEQVRKERNM